jgi:hypothetical protein
MKWVRDEKTIREHFAFWNEAPGQVWEYVCGHGTLLIRYHRPGYRFDFYVLCADCRSVRFSSIGWKSDGLRLEVKPNPKQNDRDFKFQIEDGTDLFVTCWGLSVIESEKRVHIDWPPESRIEQENQILI